MDEKNFTPNPYTVQSPPNTLTAGFVECKAIYSDGTPDPEARLYIGHNGKVEVHTGRHVFQVTGQKFSPVAVALYGAVPVVLESGDEWNEPVIGKRDVRVGIARKAWEAAAFYAVKVIADQWETGPEPTPTPPMPPLVDLGVMVQEVAVC